MHKLPATRSYRPHRWRRRDTILLCERMELYLASGLAIDAAIRTSVDAGDRHQAESLRHVLSVVESGSSVAAALKTYVGLPDGIVGLIEHGESSGGLGKAFGMAKTIMEREDDMRRTCLSAMAYPTVIAISATTLTIGLVRGVMPEIIPMLQSLHVPLPLMTRVTIALSNGFVAYGLVTGFSSAIMIIVFLYAYRYFWRFRYAVQAGLMRVPLVGSLMRKYALSVFLSSCGSLVESGMSVSRSFGRTSETVSLLPLRSVLRPQVVHLNRGISLHRILREVRMPAYIPALVMAGETSGTLGLSLRRAGAILDIEIEHLLKRLTALIEPVMMVCMGVGVGALALSIMLPIYDISRVLQK